MITQKPTWTWGSSIAACFPGEEDPERIQYLKAWLRETYAQMDTHDRQVFLMRVTESRKERDPDTYQKLLEVVQSVAQAELKGSC